MWGNHVKSQLLLIKIVMYAGSKWFNANSCGFLAIVSASGE
jgi:hypothetical protein